MTPPPNAAFSHIQIVSKASPTSVADQNPFQPPFRKPSLSQEADAAMADSTNVSLLRSADSLANNALGTTFAARARAAELQAARARKQLKDKDNTREETSTTNHEVMTFTRSRSKGSKVWKPLNLNELPEVPSDDQPELSRSQSSTSIASSIHAKQHLNLRLNHSSHPFPMLAKITAIDQKAELSPASKKLAQSVAGYDASQWDPELVSGDNSIVTVSNANVSPQNRIRSSSILELFPIPVLTSESEDVKREGEYLQYKQKALIAELTHHLGVDIKSTHGSIDGDESPSAVSTDMEVLPRFHCTRLPPTATVHHKMDTDEDPFADSPPSLPLSPDSPPSQKPYSAELNHSMPITNYSRFHYPAVKGTMKQSGSDTYLTDRQHEHLETSTKQLPMLHMDTNFPPNTYRKLSADQKKGMLLEQLHAIADSTISSGTVPAYRRTVLHDPFAHNAMRTERVETPLAASVKTKSDLIIASDPLPWKERLVDVVPTPSLSEADYVRLETQQKMADDKSSFPLPYHAEISSDGGATSNHDNVELWWRTDNRFKTLYPFVSQGQIGQARANDAGYTNTAGHPLLQASYLDDSSTIKRQQNGATDLAEGLLLPVLANLRTYLSSGGHFDKHGRVPEWCIDQGARGNESFFGEDWGAPPPRVGRDPRYQPIHHEGKFTVFDNFGRKRSNDGFPRRKMW